MSKNNNFKIIVLNYSSKIQNRLHKIFNTVFKLKTGVRLAVMIELA